MNPSHIQKIAVELTINARNVSTTAELLAGGATVPFISRYRKEATGSLDEVQITHIRDRLKQLEELDKRREAILQSIFEQGKLTDELKDKINAAETLAVLEDLYLPYRPKRRTKGTVAKEKGLEPLAEKIFAQGNGVDPVKEAQAYVNAEKKVESVDDALAGARDIIAEWINEHAEARAQLRSLFLTKGTFKSKVIRGKEVEGIKFKDYFDWEEAVSKAPSHRILAVRRGEKEGILLLKVQPPEEDGLSVLRELFIKADNLCARQVEAAMADSYKRLLSLSLETEVRMFTKHKADEEAIRVFADNLRQLLMAAPLGQKNVLAVDPGYRTGCKIVCLDRQGKLLHNETIYPTQSQNMQEQAARRIREMCSEYKIEYIAIGNGTASRETESFIRALNISNVAPVLVNESGASVYSASDVAREEFPGHDVTVRGAVSIGRRLMDPLAELVKIDPKSIGVGQYQHDVDQAKLKDSLDDIVVSCVNQVGVELNTASKQLLMYVSGLGPALAQAIVEYRNQHGAFKSRAQVREVPKLGAKAFEQAAGFLRIHDADNPLDKSAVHPESYEIVEKMATDLKCTVMDFILRDDLRNKIDLHKYINDKVGLPTLVDIKNELAKPGRDPREQFETVEFKEGVETIDHLTTGMKLNGIVTNITDFGAFVDIGVHHDGLVHISQMSDKFVARPSDVVKVHQKVVVTVLEVDKERKRIALSMKDAVDKPKEHKSVSVPINPTKSVRPAAAAAAIDASDGKRKMTLKDLKWG